MPCWFACPMLPAGWETTVETGKPQFRQKRASASNGRLQRVQFILLTFQPPDCHPELPGCHPERSEGSDRSMHNSYYSPFNSQVVILSEAKDLIAACTIHI